MPVQHHPLAIVADDDRRGGDVDPLGLLGEGLLKGIEPGEKVDDGLTFTGIDRPAGEHGVADGLA